MAKAELNQIYAHAKAVFLRRIEVTGEKLFIRCGLFGDTEIDLQNIAFIEQVAVEEMPEGDLVKLSPLGKLAQGNIAISLNEETVLNGIYGSRKNFKSILLGIDDVEGFTTAVEKNLEKLRGE